MSNDEFDPQEVARIVAQALKDQSVMPLSFIETTLFDRLNSLLVRYMPQADVTWVMSELKNEFLKGFTKMNPERLHGLIQACTKCESVARPPVQPKWNTTDPDLMLIAENPSKVDRHYPMLRDSLRDAGFKSQRCMLTYVTRCSIDKPTATIISNCLPYLHTELAVINPRLVITLGLGPYTALTGDSTSKLNDIKGSIFWFGPYAILPEQSLAGGAHAQERTNSHESYLKASLTTAQTFLYGGKSSNESQVG